MERGTPPPPDAATGARLSAATATPRQRGAGIAMVLASTASNQVGATVGATAFPVIGPVGVVAVRQLVTATVLGLTVRPRLGALRKGRWPILGLVVVFSVMNLSLYVAIDRIGIALAVTLEFLGPLGVAIASSRRVLDFGCAALAAVGVVVLTHPGPTADLVGIAIALVAALCWASYILLNRTLGQRLSGLQGPAAASVVTAAVWVPIASFWFAAHPPTADALLRAAVCGVLSSVVPYAADLVTLRRVPAQLFGTLASISPVWAALAGWLILHESLQVNEWAGIALIVASNVIVSLQTTTRRQKAAPSD